MKGATTPGKVWLVGAGPGDPELLTLRALRVLSRAEVVAYDELVSPDILALTLPSAERVPVGRRAHGCRHHDDRIHPIVLERARAGQMVVRLKGGDPFVFGRGGEEAEELARAGIPYEVVPGVSAAMGAAAATGIPLTHREVTASVTLATAHAQGDGDADLYTHLPRSGTVVLYMGLGRLGPTAASLIQLGRSPNTPVAVVAHATLVSQRVVWGTLATIADLVVAANLPAPAIVIVGDVVSRAVAPTLLPREP